MPYRWPLDDDDDDGDDDDENHGLGRYLMGPTTIALSCHTKHNRPIRGGIKNCFFFPEILRKGGGGPRRIQNFLNRKKNNFF